MSGPRHKRPLEDRLWERVDKSGSCWLWTGPLKSNGYAWIRTDQGRIAVHRVAYELTVGPIPAGLELDHLCNVRHCVRPEHLEPVTRAENNARKVPRRTHCKRGHAYEPDNYWLVTNGRGLSRRCKQCRRLRGQVPAAGPSEDNPAAG